MTEKDFTKNSTSQDPSRYSVDVRSPADTSEQLRGEFMLLVRKGGEVRKETLAVLMTDALVLGTVRTSKLLIAVGGIKRPDDGYRAKVFAKAGLGDPGRFPYELGWVFVDERYRRKGISTALVSALAQRLGDAPAYATTRVDNEGMHRSLAMEGFKPAGMPYPSTRKGDHLQVFLREDSVAHQPDGAS